MVLGRRRSTRWLSAVLVALLAAGNATAQGAPRAGPTAEPGQLLGALVACTMLLAQPVWRARSACC